MTGPSVFAPGVVAAGLIPGATRTTSDAGDIAETYAKAMLLQCGFNVITADRAASRFDFLLEQADGFRKIQVKKGAYSKGAIKFNTASVLKEGDGRKAYRAGEVDAFVVFCEELMALYYVPFQEAPAGGVCCLRVAPPKNGQVAGVRLAADYQVCRLFETPRCGGGLQ